MAIWQAKRDDGARAYWKCVLQGVLKTGLVAGDFTVMCIAPDDSDSVTLTVSESTQQAGVYYVDVPASFLKTNGEGSYGLSIGTHTAEIDDEVLYSLFISEFSLTDVATSGHRIRWR